MLMASGRVKFVGKVDAPVSSGPITFPTGSEAGDLAILIASGSSVSVPGWAAEALGANLHVLSKRLTAEDIDSPPGFVGSVGAFGVLVYRGGVRLDLASSASVGDHPATIPGFNKSGAKAIVLAAVFSANFSTSPPATFTTRQSFVSDGGFSFLSAADLLSPSQYGNGAAITWGNGGGTSGGTFAAFQII
jgi:hypothetical protein